MNINQNIANALTLFRLMVLPVFAFLALSDDGVLQLAAAILFGVAALTDWLDGLIARKYNQASEFGAILDPLVDRVFIVASLIILYFKIGEAVPLWTVIIIIARDLSMVVGWVLIKAYRGNTVSVTYAGKISTAVLLISLFLILTGKSIAVTPLLHIGIAAYYLGLMLSVATGLSYAYSVLKDDIIKPEAS